jgi:hypothetical protein
VSITVVTKKLSHPWDSARMVTLSFQNVTPPFLSPLLALICKCAPNPLVTHFACDQDQSRNDFPLMPATHPVAQIRLINFGRFLVKYQPFCEQWNSTQLPLFLKSLVGKRIYSAFCYTVLYSFIQCYTFYTPCSGEFAKIKLRFPNLVTHCVS